MYVIGWQDINGALYTARHAYVRDAASAVRMIQRLPDMRGIGVQTDTIDQLLVLVVELDGAMPFDGECVKAAFGHVADAIIEFGISNPCVRAPFMEARDEQVGQQQRR